MRDQDSNVIPFPTRAAGRPRTRDHAPETGDAVHNAARAGAATAEAVAAILGERTADPAGADALSASKAVNAGVLWGAVLGVARCHGQIPALAALEHIVERLREDPHRLITEPQRRSAADATAASETARAVRTLLA